MKKRRSPEDRPGAELGRLAEERALAKGIKLSEAFDQVKRERPDLLAKYLNAVGAGGHSWSMPETVGTTTIDPRVELTELVQKRATRDGISFIEALAHIKAEHFELVERVGQLYRGADNSR